MKQDTVLTLLVNFLSLFNEKHNALVFCSDTDLPSELKNTFKDILFEVLLVVLYIQSK